MSKALNSLQHFYLIEFEPIRRSGNTKTNSQSFSIIRIHQDKCLFALIKINKTKGKKKLLMTLHKNGKIVEKTITRLNSSFEPRTHT